MTISAPCYVTREATKTALDVAETARSNSRVDRAIETATTTVDGFLRRRFSPVVATRYFGWPSDAYRTPWRLWLDADEIISLTSLTSGGVTIPQGAYFLEPINDGPPYRSIEINLAGSSALTAGQTHQRAIIAAGLFGYRDDTRPAGTIVEDLDASETAVDVSTAAGIGVGDLLKVDSERMLVTERTMVTTGQTLQTPLAASASAVTVAVTTGSAYTADEVLLLDSERMLVTDVAGNNLTVKRAWDGSVLATHTGSTIYAPRTLTVVRGAAGTTAASHTNSTVLTAHVPPPLTRDLALAYALNQLLQEGAGYARVAGSGDNQRELTGRGIGAIEADAMERHGRQLLQGAV